MHNINFKKIIPYIAILSFLFFGNIAFADETITTATSHSADAFGYGAAARDKSAQSFTTGTGGYASTILFYMDNAGGATDQATVSLQADSGGAPSGTDIETETFSATAGCNSHLWTLTDSNHLNGGTTYWIVWGRTGTLVGYDYDLCGTDPSSYSGGTAADNDLGSWTNKNRDGYAEIFLTDSGVSGGGGDSTTTVATTSDAVGIAGDTLFRGWCIFMGSMIFIIWFFGRRND